MRGEYDACSVVDQKSGLNLVLELFEILAAGASNKHTRRGIGLQWLSI